MARGLSERKQQAQSKREREEMELRRDICEKYGVKGEPATDQGVDKARHATMRPRGGLHGWLMGDSGTCTAGRRTTERGAKDASRARLPGSAGAGEEGVSVARKAARWNVSCEPLLSLRT